MSPPNRTGVIAFKPRARILKLIGEELISDEVVALSELVKNAHDADAHTVTISFRAVTASGGEIEVRDDGVGMDLDTLLGRWMEPAASTKVGKGRQITRLGRRVLGEKGVGRFAADKLARHLEIVSRCSGCPEEIQACVDWDKFDTDTLMLADIQNRWEVRPACQIKSHGTVLHMRGLRCTWTERMFRRLCIRLSRLLSPFREKDQFTIQIDSDEFPEYSGELRRDFLKRAPYWVEARFDGQQTITISLGGRRAMAQRWNGQGELTCGPVRIRLYAFDLESEALARIGPRVEVRGWMREWTGVSIYRDGFRVWPYGEPDDDWLRLDQRRVNSPVDHLSNNQVIGFIEIGRDSNPDLMDQTNREGLIFNQAFEDLRRLVYFVLQALEAERQSIRRPARRLAQVQHESCQETALIADALEALATRIGGSAGKEMRQLKQRVEEHLVRESAEHHQTLVGYSGLAAIGQMVSGMVPIVAHEIEAMRSQIDRLRQVLASRKIPEGREAMAELASSLASLGETQRMMLATTGSNERRRAIDVLTEISTFREFISTLLDSRDVRMEILSGADEVLRTEMRPENFYCLMQILTINALDWLRGIESPRIRITVQANADHCEIIFSDNGPGIPPEFCLKIFSPLFSRKEGGRGMGLTIARQLVESHGGRIQYLLDGRRKGANFLITLLRKRPRATIYDVL